MAAVRSEVGLLRTLAPTDHGLTIFDADTQETSYGTLVVDGLPLIFDTHRKDLWYVSSVEILTEVGVPPRVQPGDVRAFSRAAEREGMQAIPYSACFFKGNLHVYAFHGPVRGFDLAAVGDSVPEAERKLDKKLRCLWDRIPGPILRAQRELLAGKRKARYPADLEVLLGRKENLEADSAKTEPRRISKRALASGAERHRPDSLDP